VNPLEVDIPDTPSNDEYVQFITRPPRPFAKEMIAYILTHDIPSYVLDGMFLSDKIQIVYRIFPYYTDNGFINLTNIEFHKTDLLNEFFHYADNDVLQVFSVLDYRFRKKSKMIIPEKFGFSGNPFDTSFVGSSFGTSRKLYHNHNFSSPVSVHTADGKSDVYTFLRKKFPQKELDKFIRYIAIELKEVTLDKNKERILDELFDFDDIKFPNEQKINVMKNL